MTDLNRETYASDVLEGWMPDLPDFHPDDTPRAFDDDGAPLLSCPLVRAVNVHTMMVNRPNGVRTREVVKFDGARVESALESGAIEGAGGTWWIPKSSAWSVEPSRIRALSPRGRSWLKATLSRLSHATTPGETDQRTAPLAKAFRACRDTSYRFPGATFYGKDPATGEVVLSLRCDHARALAIVEAYSVAGRPLVLRAA